MSKKLTKSGLTPKQELFCQEYIKDMNATQAYLRAGFSKKATTAGVEGHKLLKNPKVKQRIQELQQRVAKKNEITAEWVLGKIKETIERCSQAEPVLDKEGNPTGEWKFEHSGVLKGTEQLGKHLKLFTDKVEHSGVVTLEQLVVGTEEDKE